jgi:hypothetical protein
MKPKAIFIIDSLTIKNIGIIAFIIIAIATIIQLVTIIYFETIISWLTFVMFVLGGFFGRAFEKKNTEKKL